MGNLVIFQADLRDNHLSGLQAEAGDIVQARNSGQHSCTAALKRPDPVNPRLNQSAELLSTMCRAGAHASESESANIHG